ncbi:GRF1-interacting factor 3-like isoform X2 [Andrographis paniculata]|uniref:GRF1-interacting factor 3-like isoform X2 n=1 Tax=Andrographis paniculata TaxID=175694 RepID=UPI0021E99566|nr:GRF1-interacting factor 3-like isoform X2 [Andrographis paniculata]
MQQPGTMFSVLSPFPPTNITTEQIQKYLDENKKLILAILDNQNLGKLNECAQYQAQLQKNLMYLAAIADAQPQTPAMPTQMPPHPAMHQGGFYMQQPQQPQQPGLFPSRATFNSPHPLQDPHLQQHQAPPHLQPPQAQMSLRSVGPNSGVNPTLNDTNLGGVSSSGVPTSNSGLNDARGGNNKDKPDGNSDAAGNTGGGDGEQAK